MRFRTRILLFASGIWLSVYVLVHLFSYLKVDKERLHLYFEKNEFTPRPIRHIRKTDYSNYELKKKDTCDNRTSLPSYDIQMFNLYSELDFYNSYGGPWTQGWNIQIKKDRWNPKNKLKIFLVPHSHNDPGWKKTFEQYYESQTRQIFNNMIVKLAEDPRRKFIWAEVSFLSLWWAESSESSREEFKKLLKNGQIEIVSGGWVMPDEANSHYYSLIQELTHGHQWLEKHLNYRPKRSWCIDPFGTSPTLPYLLQHFGLESLVIQRTHYSVKKYLAKHKQLEFRWRQFWDGSGKFDFLTHMMPFFIYDIPHTCGPDPSVCCQFDFRRSASSGMFCPWKKQPQMITDKNVAFRAHLLLDQYRRKAELFSTNVLLVPLGDDFRFDVTSEWDQQYMNYQKLFDFMNNNSGLYVEAKFGTLNDYFEALLTEIEPKQFPSLSGDFFTYADRDDHYWSGYFTSRPYYKRMDRELISYLRSAEILHAITWKSAPFQLSRWLLSEDSGLIELLRNARSSLSLFQHHDGVTGTAKDFVVNDYASKLLRSINGVQHVMQQSLKFLLHTEKQNVFPDSEVVYFEMKESRKTPENEVRKISVTEFEPVKRIVIFNPLTWNRTEVLNVQLENYKNVILVDENDLPVLYQISPFCEINDLSQVCYLMHFEVKIKPLSVTTLFLKFRANLSNSENLASLNILNEPEIFKLKGVEDFLKHQHISSDFSIENSKISVTFRSDGLMKAITLKNRDLTASVHLSFIGYACKRSREMCGAYLFLPDGNGRPIECARPRIKIIEGKLVSSVTVFCDFVIHEVKIFNCPGSEENIVELQNLVDIRSEHNFEIAMKLSTSIKNQQTFYTDLNGFQIVKRRFFSKLPLQGNYYPIPSSIYIEDDESRLTLVSAQPLGGGSLGEGEIEIMQDRRLNQDDNLGLGQGVLDNRPILHIFRLTLEKRIANCRKMPNSYPAGHLSVISYLTMNAILYPLMLFVKTDKEVAFENLRNSFTMDELSRISKIDVHLVSVTSIPETSSVGLVFHRPELDTCFLQEYENYPLNDGLVNISAYIPFGQNDVIYRSSLSFLQIDEKLDKNLYPLCLMDLTAFYVRNLNMVAV